LKPLAGQWDKISDQGKKKWLAVADKYPAMKPDEQKRLQTRMSDWAKLTPEQRREAREVYKSTKAVPVEQKKAEWQKYQSLPEAEKKKLAAAAEAKKPVKQKAARRQLATRGSKPGVPAKPANGATPVTAAPALATAAPVAAPTTAPAAAVAATPAAPATTPPPVPVQTTPAAAPTSMPAQVVPQTP